MHTHQLTGFLNLAGYDYEKLRDFHSYLSRDTFRWHTYPLTSYFFPHFSLLFCQEHFQMAYVSTNIRFLSSFFTPILPETLSGGIGIHALTSDFFPHFSLLFCQEYFQITYVSTNIRFLSSFFTPILPETLSGGIGIH